MQKEQNDNKILEKLINKKYENNRGELYNQYELYVKMIDQISNRRSIANGFYLIANSILLVAMSVIGTENLGTDSIFFFILIIGLTSSISWLQLIKKYKNLTCINLTSKARYFFLFILSFV